MVTEAPQGEGRVKIRENDRYSRNPDVRRRYWLGTVGNKISEVGADLSGRVGRISEECWEIFQNGGIWDWYQYNVMNLVSPPYEEQAEALLAEIGDIVHEKGFRFSNALLTPREHQRIGSTIWHVFVDMDPDMPVPFLEDRLIAEGKIEDKSRGYSIEELDRARRLEGMTVLDLETGRATDEKDEEAAHDSYHFLPPERKVEVMAREQVILQELTALATAAVSDFEPVAGMVDLIAEYMEGRITSPQMQEQYAALITSKGYQLDLLGVIEEAKQLAFETGKWDRILTPQEILLRLRAKVDKKYRARPYTPLAIQDGEPAGEIMRLREGEGSMVVTSGVLPYAMWHAFRLEPLDEQGNTVKSPTFLNRETLESEDDRFRESSFADQITVRFARPEDWFYHPPAK